MNLNLSDSYQCFLSLVVAARTGCARTFSQTNLRQTIFPLVAILLLLPFQAIPQSTSENTLKAQYVLNVSKFISWPENEKPERALCLLGNDAIAESLQQLSGSTIGGKVLTYQQFRNQGFVDNCDVLFIGKSEKRITSSLVSRLSNNPILTISDQADFIQQGGMVSLYRKGSRLGFDINIEAAKTANIAISSKLLKLAGNKKAGGS